MDFRNLLNDLLLVNGKSKMELSKEAQIPYTTISVRLYVWIYCLL